MERRSEVKSMNTSEKRKYAVTATDAAMNKFIKGLKLDAVTEDKLFHVVLDHVNAVGADAYADGVRDTTALIKSVNLANQIKAGLKNL